METAPGSRQPPLQHAAAVGLVLLLGDGDERRLTTVELLLGGGAPELDRSGVAGPGEGDQVPGQAAGERRIAHSSGALEAQGLADGRPVPGVERHRGQVQRVPLGAGGPGDVGEGVKDTGGVVGLVDRGQAAVEARLLGQTRGGELGLGDVIAGTGLLVNRFPGPVQDDRRLGGLRPGDGEAGGPGRV